MNWFIGICSTLFVIAAHPASNASGTVNFHSADQLKPDLDCVFFGNIGCHATCALVGKLYVQGGAGTCDEKFTCVCNLYQSTSTDDLWNSKFVKNAESDLFLNQVKANSQMHDKVYPMLVDPLLSGAVLKEHLINFFPEDKHLNLLQPKTDQLINRYVTDIQHFNTEDSNKLINFVKTELSEIPQDLVNYLISDNYRDRIKQFSKDVNDQVTIKHVIKQMKRISHISFVFCTINYIEDKHKLTKDKNVEDETSAQKIINTIADSVLEALMSIVNKGPSSPNNLNQNHDMLNHMPPVKASAEMVSNKIDEFGNTTREWRNKNSYIRYFKDKSGDETLHWRLDNTLIHLYQDKRGEVFQEWNFGEVSIRLNNFKEGIVEHTWDLGKTQHFYRKSKEGMKDAGWTYFTDIDALTTYKNYIKTWCAQNIDLFPNKCVIFEY